MPTPTPPDDDDDAELELEAVDPEILAHERQRAQRRTDDAVASINPDEVFPDEHADGLGVDWQGLRQFRFTTRHLLIATAVLALVLTLFLKVRACNAISLLGAAALGGGWFWVLRQERRAEAERARRREEFFAGRGARGGASTAGAGEELDDAPPPPRDPFKFAFSMQQMLVALTAAAVLMGLAVAIGLEQTAMVLGTVALVGIGVLLLFDPPAIVVLGWFILLVLYLVVGLIAAIRGNFGDESAARRPAAPVREGEAPAEPAASLAGLARQNPRPPVAPSQGATA